MVKIHISMQLAWVLKQVNDAQFQPIEKKNDYHIIVWPKTYFRIRSEGLLEVIMQRSRRSVQR